MLKSLKVFTSTNEQRSGLLSTWRASAVEAKARRAFTVMEVLIIVAIIGVIALFTTAVDSNSISRTNVNAERNTLVELLVHARSQSMNNENELTHGVHITDSDFILFEGVYGVGDQQETARNTNVTGGSGTEVVFDQLTGETIATTIVLTGPSKSETISINEEGMIDW